MNTILNLSLIAAVTTVTMSGPLAAEESYWVALSTDVSMNRISIANAGQGDKTVWIQRNYAQPLSLGVDTQSGQEIYPHQSVQLQYVVNCAQGKLNMVSWKMLSDANSRGNLMWESAVPRSDADYRYSPGTEEEKSVAATLCGTSVGSR